MNAHADHQSVAPDTATGAPDPVLVLCDLLADDDWVTRRVAAVELGKLRDRRAVDPLCICMRDHDPDVRGTAVWALAAIGDPRAAEALIARLEDPDAAVREAAAQALGALGWQPVTARDRALLAVARRDWTGALDEEGSALVPLCAGLQDRDAAVRMEAANTLGLLGDAGARDFLADRLTDDEPSVRHAATLALARLGDRRAVEPLCALLAASDGDGRRLAARLLAGLGDVRATEPLCGCLEDPDPSTRSAVIRALGVLGFRAAVPALQSRLALRGAGETDREARREIEFAIAAIKRATAAVRAVPIPSSAPVPEAATLPIPGSHLPPAGDRTGDA